MQREHLMSAAETGLLVIDVQEKLMPLSPDARRITLNISFLLDVAALLKLPIQATEQYPRGLGPTIPELANRLPERPEKLDFSCCAVPLVLDHFRAQKRSKLLLAGIEAHVCVQQTALELLDLGFEVFIAADAIASRAENDKTFALRRLEKAGCVLTTSEAAAFEWVGRAGTPEFKTLSKLVQERMKGLAEIH
jgi:nicotinamidase-related amidase